MAKIKKDDFVEVRCGSAKKERGKVIAVVTKMGRTKVKVEGAKLATKHIKPNPSANIAGGREQREQLIDISNVAIVNPSTDKADKVAYKFLDDGGKKRYFKSTGEVVDV